MSAMSYSSLNAKRLFSNTLSNLLTRLVILGSRLFAVIILARYLGQSSFGDYSYIVAVIGSIEVISDLGLNQIAIREIAKQRESAASFLGNVFILKFIMITVTVVTVAIVGQYSTSRDEIRYAIYLYGIGSTLHILADSNFVLFRAFEVMHYETIIHVIDRIVYITLIAGAVFIEASFITLFYVHVLAALVKLAVSTVILRQKFQFLQMKFDWILCKTYLLQSLPVGVGLLISAASLRIDIILLYLIDGSQTAGIFSGPYRIIDAIGIMSLVFITALFPIVSRNTLQDWDIVYQIVNRAVRLILIFAVPCSIWVAVFAKPIVLWTLGSKYSHSIQVLQVLAICIVPIYLDRLFNYVFIAINQQKRYVKISSSALLLNILLDCLLIPFFGVWGACIGTVSAEIVRAGLTYRIIRKELGSMHLASRCKQLILPTVGLALSNLLLPSYLWPLTTVCGFVLYFATLFFTRAIERDERQWLETMFNKVLLRKEVANTSASSHL